MKEQRSARRTYLRFALIMLACVVVGFPLGLLLGWGRLNSAPLSVGNLAELAIGTLPVFWWVVTLAILITALALYFRIRHQVSAWDGEDEEVIQAIERKLNVPLAIANIYVALDLIYFSLLTCAMEHTAAYEYYLLGLGAFLAGLVVYLIIAVLVVNLTKRINPEKQGHALDTDFQKRWLASCDEAEQQAIFKASYTAYRVASIACIILWGLLSLAQLGGLVGAMPGLCVVAIWLVMISSYTIACIKLQK